MIRLASFYAEEVLTGVVIPFPPRTVFGTKKFNELMNPDESGVWTEAV